MADLNQIPFTNSRSAYKNKLLFTEHYLEHRIIEDPVWMDAAIHDRAKEKLAQLRDKRQQIQPQNLKEAQLEKQWIRWILTEILGHHFAVQVTLDYGDSKHGIPDMVFTGTDAEANAIGNQKHNADSLSTPAIAIGDAKAWGINFEKASKGSQSAVQQIDKYLRYSELPWGILSDGRYWRLYERNSSKFNKYYEIDLEQLIDSDDVSQFLYFYLFFRQEAFTGNWLNNVLKGSQDFAENLRDSLEEEVFSALEDIAQGFLTYRRNEIDFPPSEEKLTEIYEQSLILLYRLLFIFYAESRDILPMHNEDYKQRSLQSLIKQATFVKSEGKKRGVDDTTLYAPLSDLFFNIDKGYADYGMTPYNGKLFSRKSYPFLDKNAVGDYHLAPAIHKLATIEVKQGRTKKTVSVDYRDLDVGHLGTIYEKLLEYRLDIATEDLVTSGKNQTYKTAKPGQNPTKKAGEVYLRTGNHERKVTGSYYTPEYIVRFIVEKTLEPLLLDITEKHASQDDEGNWQVSDPEALRDAILALNVLDPATGSGHFAVDVVVYIAEWLHGLALDLPEIASEPDPLSYWMRQVAGSCIYAVDINPLAVELAKLSIWLKTLARDKPLSFLDHHIRVGNSLVGTNLADIDTLASTPKKGSRRKKVDEKQPPLFDETVFTRGVESAVGTMTRIERILANDVSEVKQQEQMYAEIRQKLKPYEQLATVWTARHFGLVMDEGEWEALYKLSLEGTLTTRLKNIIARAEAIAARPDMRFFHWDVAFPEVFFDETGKRLDNAGFDAVVGNPPYVRQESITGYKDFFETYNVYSGRADLYLYFYESGIELLRDGARLAYITPGTYMNTGSAKNFRKYLPAKTNFEYLVDFVEVQPFKGVDLATNVMIAVLQKNKKIPRFITLKLEGKKTPDSLNDLLSYEGFETLQDISKKAEWRFQPAELTKLFANLMQRDRFSDAVSGEIYAGSKTGLNEAFIIDNSIYSKLIAADKNNQEVLKPMVRGEDLRPWYQKQGSYIIFTYRGIEIEKYPTIKAYLEQYKPALESRATIDSHAWYELQQPQMGIYPKYDDPKIMWTGIAKIPRYSWDNKGLYLNEACFIAPTNGLHILSILNSRVLWFALSQMATPLRLRAGLWQYQGKIQFVERLPIPELTSAQESELATIAETITGYAGERYQLHEDVRRNLLDDFGNAGDEISSRVSLYQWWQYDVQANFSEFNEELKRRFGKELSVGTKRDSWRKYMTEKRSAHESITQKIVDEETRMNAIVYDAFALDAEERALIETATKYPYGAV